MNGRATLLIVFCIISFFAHQSIIAQNVDSSKTDKGEKYAWQNLVFGGQLLDLYQPVPIINELESEGILGDADILPRDKDNGYKHEGWRVWGGNPVFK